MHRLTALLEDAAQGRFPPADGTVELLPPPPGDAHAVVAFSAHFAIATTAPDDWLLEKLPPGDLHAPTRPAFLAELAQRTGRAADGLDVVLAAPSLPGEPELEQIGDSTHPRVARAQHHRTGVRVYGYESATVILGHGLAGRTEIAFEVDPDRRSQGVASRAITEARRLTRGFLYAQTAPGNAASLRTLLAAGFTPIGSEALLTRRRS